MVQRFYVRFQGPKTKSLWKIHIWKEGTERYFFCKHAQWNTKIQWTYRHLQYSSLRRMMQELESNLRVRLKSKLIRLSRLLDQQYKTEMPLQTFTKVRRLKSKDFLLNSYHLAVASWRCILTNISYHLVVTSWRGILTLKYVCREVTFNCNCTCIFIYCFRSEEIVELCHLAEKWLLIKKI